MNSTTKPSAKTGSTSVAKRAQGIQFKATPVAAPSSSPKADTAPSTDQSNGVPQQKPQPSAGGGMTGIQYLASTFQQNHRVAELEGEVERLKQERGAQLLDANLIARSRWANRHPDSFKSPEFESLRAEIESAGGNMQPIMVRPFPEGSRGPHGERYEVVFGHRRHEACRQLGLPVSAVLKELDEAALFIHMERENRERAALSAWEQGMMYRRAVEERLFPTKHKLATSIGVDPSQLNKALAIAELPDAVVQAFESPTQIQYRFAQPLISALAKNPDAVTSKAGELAGSKTPAHEVFNLLISAADGADADGARSGSHKIDLGSGHSVLLRIDKKGRLLLESSPGLLSQDRLGELGKALRAFFK
jgi:ParB family chromosome partitioning protein